MCEYASLANIKDGTIVLAAFVAMYVSTSGLNAWKRQKIGTDRISTVRNAKKNLLTYRERIKRVRDLNSLINDMPKPTKEDREKYTAKQDYISKLRSSYDLLLEELTNAKLELESSLLEVEVASSSVLQSTIDSVFGHEDELRRTVRAFIAWQDSDLPQDYVTAAWNVLDPRFEIVVPNNINSDEFAEKFNTDMDKLNKELNYRQIV